MITITWTPEKEKAVIEAIDKYIKEHDISCSESVQQSDSSYIDLPNMFADLVDDVIKPEYHEDAETDNRA